jgi:hypothetical protein
MNRALQMVKWIESITSYRAPDNESSSSPPVAGGGSDTIAPMTSPGGETAIGFLASNAAGSGGAGEKKGKKRASLVRTYSEDAIDPSKIAKAKHEAQETGSSSRADIVLNQRKDDMVPQSTSLANTNEIYFGNISNVIVHNIKNAIEVFLETNKVVNSKNLHEKMHDKLKDTERLHYRIREELRDLGGIKELKERWKKQIELMSGKKIKETRPGHFDFILRLSNTLEQPEHQESPSHLGTKEWQVLMALHTSSLNTTTTAIKYNDKYIGLNLQPGDYVIISGDVWHFGTKVVNMSEDKWEINGISYMPLFTCYFKEV